MGFILLLFVSSPTWLVVRLLLGFISGKQGLAKSVSLYEKIYLVENALGFSDNVEVVDMVDNCRRGYFC